MATRAQLLSAGCTVAQIRAQVAAGRWQIALLGVYALFNGPIPPRARIEAALLRAGPGACAGPWSSLFLAGAVDDLPRVLDGVVPLERRVRCPELRITRRTDLAAVVHPAARPARLRLEVAVLDACDGLDRPEHVVDLVIRVVQRRLTTELRLRETLTARSRHRWRALLCDLPADVAVGVRSALEHLWLHKVIKPHGLPVGSLDRVDHDGSGRVYRDVWFEEYDVVVELDGRLSHPFKEAFRDRRRDNRVTLSGRATLRYGWHETHADSCAVAAELTTVLRGRGADVGLPCGPGCPVLE